MIGKVDCSGAAGAAVARWRWNKEARLNGEYQEDQVMHIAEEVATALERMETDGNPTFDRHRSCVLMVIVPTEADSHSDVARHAWSTATLVFEPQVEQDFPWQYKLYFKGRQAD